MQSPKINSTALFLGVSLVCMSAQAAEDPVLTYYADTYNVTVEQARERLNLAPEIARVSNELERRFPNQFGGLFVKHEPDFRVVVKMTGAGQGLLRQVTSDPRFVVEQATTPINQLNQLKERIGRRLAQETGYQFSASVNVWDGTVDIQTTDIEDTRSRLTNDLTRNQNIRLIQIEEGVKNHATIRGGVRLTGTVQRCTSGFNVSSSLGDGLITAGHCDDSMTISGVQFRLAQRLYQNSETQGFDFQFMRPVSGVHVFPNDISRGGSVTETITATMSAAQIPLNWTVCAYGASTGSMRCGTLQAKGEIVRDDNNVVNYVYRVAPQTASQAMTIGGDSGGPVFGAGTAYGIIKGRGTSANINHMIFVDIATLSTLNNSVRVKTAP